MSTADELHALTEQLAGLLLELAEVEVAESDARLVGYQNSPENSVTAREWDSRANARQWHGEQVRLRARVEAARIRRETALTLLTLPESP